jgi:hypothetical protein
MTRRGHRLAVAGSSQGLENRCIEAAFAYYALNGNVALGQ